MWACKDVLGGGEVLSLKMCQVKNSFTKIFGVNGFYFDRFNRERLRCGRGLGGPGCGFYRGHVKFDAVLG